ncbi:efflux transporter outer membrane subunit [Sphingomonas sp.]|uniref:efflux transporter outer membrane subunit n=1 Tax=Sphingomonas sp. TaxID=28214 RepID=UPI003B00B13F
MRTAVLLASALAGCTVGPRYAGPPAGAGTSFVRAGDLAATSPALAEWWTVLGDARLDALEAEALARSPDVAVAAARIAQARAALGQTRASNLPGIKASALYAHAHIPGVSFGRPVTTEPSATAGDSDADDDLDLFNLGFNASWEVDLFGGRRHAVEAARATEEEMEASRSDAQVSLTAAVANAYLGLRDHQRQLALATRSIAMQEERLALTSQRYAGGTASRLDVERLSQQLDRTRADAAPVAAAIDGDLDQLATLAGAEPGTLDADLRADAPIPLPPAQVAVGDPAALIRRRPDVRAAERALAADTARIGQARAARFPQLSLMGIFGIGGSHPSDLTHLDDFTALAAPQLSWSFLDFGRTAARVHQAEGARDETEARYRKAVLGALRDAEDSLSRFRAQRVAVATLARARASADAVADLSNQRYRAGTTTLIDLLDAQRQQIAAEQSLADAEAGLTRDFVAIHKALGLGWRNESATPKPALAAAGARDPQPSRR